MHRTCKPPDEETVDCPKEGAILANGLCHLCHVVQQPPQLVRTEIGIDGQPRYRPKIVLLPHCTSSEEKKKIVQPPSGEHRAEVMIMQQLILAAAAQPRVATTLIASPTAVHVLTESQAK